jgi:lysozyme
MITINRKVLDISHHNTVTSWQQIKAAGIVGIIHKATEGGDYADANYLEAKHQALELGLLFGAYHFATNSSVGQQVEHFLSTAGIEDGLLYCLDWEDYGDDTMSRSQAEDFLRRCDEVIGERATVLYSGNRAKDALGDARDEFFGEHRLWLAQYGSDPSCQASWPTWWLWQYSDGKAGPQPHGCPGVSGEVDTNSWDGTDDELRAQWSGTSSIAPAERPTVSIDIATQGDVAVFINGKPVG